jgi:hypothetical protein
MFPKRKQKKCHFGGINQCSDKTILDVGCWMCESSHRGPNDDFFSLRNCSFYHSILSEPVGTPNFALWKLETRGSCGRASVGGEKNAPNALIVPFLDCLTLPASCIWLNHKTMITKHWKLRPDAWPSTRQFSSVGWRLTHELLAKADMNLNSAVTGYSTREAAGNG